MSIPTVNDLAASARSTRWVLASRPSGWPTEDDVRQETVELPELSDGEIRVVNEAISVDPYMRGRMNDMKSYVPPFELDAPLDGGAVGEVIASRSNDVAVGQRVTAGQKIASIGSEGQSTGPHLHFEIKPDGQTQVDPVGWFAAQGIKI